MTLPVGETVSYRADLAAMEPKFVKGLKPIDAASQGLMASGEAAQSRETRSGLDPWRPADLPVPPRPRGLGWLGVVGPASSCWGSIGSGEFLLGPGRSSGTGCRCSG